MWSRSGRVGGVAFLGDAGGGEKELDNLPSFSGEEEERKAGKAGLEQWRVLWVDIPSYYGVEGREKIEC